jgi:hypothetical protein
VAGADAERKRTSDELTLVVVLAALLMSRAGRRVCQLHDSSSADAATARAP